MKLQKVHSILMIIILLTLVKVSTASDDIVILEMFGVKGYQQVITSGDTCWALIGNKNETLELVRTIVEIDTFTNYNQWDNIYFVDWKYTITGIDTSKDRLMIYTGLNHLLPGEIKTALCSKSIIVGDTINLAFNFPKDYLLTATGIVQEHYVQDYQPHLIDNTLSQPKYQNILSQGSVCRYNEPVMLWAGDLDQDRKIDFMFLDAPETSEQYYVLYLSSFARDSLIVGKAGIIDYPSGE